MSEDDKQFLRERAEIEKAKTERTWIIVAAIIGVILICTFACIAMGVLGSITQ